MGLRVRNELWVYLRRFPASDLFCSYHDSRGLLR